MTRNKQFYIYILSNKYNTVFYTGVSNDLIRRVYEHKNKLVEGFTKRYNITQLLYYECADNPESAILREKQIKDYNRSKKLKLIQDMNPQMTDLYPEVIGKGGDLSPRHSTELEMTGKRTALRRETIPLFQVVTPSFRAKREIL